MDFIVQISKIFPHLKIFRQIDLQYNSLVKKLIPRNIIGFNTLTALTEK